jgi:hypothetical protein
VQIDAARTSQIFYGVNGQCADTSGGPWYVGIVNGLCEDIPGRYTITSRSSCQDGFDTGLLASVGVRTRPVTTPVVPSFWGCNTKGDYKSHAACDDVYHLNYIVKTDDGLNPYITNYQIDQYHSSAFHFCMACADIVSPTMQYWFAGHIFCPHVQLPEFLASPVVSGHSAVKMG